MSQVQTINPASANPQIPTSIETDDGTASALSNVLIVNGIDSDINVDNGIIVIGGIVGTGTQNKIDVVLTNRVTGTVTTTDATPTTIVSFTLGSSPGVYLAEGNVLGYNVSDSAGGAYTYIGAATTDGVTASEISVENKNIFEQAGMLNSDITFSVSGNSVDVIVVGIAGKTIHWNCLFTYRTVS